MKTAFFARNTLRAAALGLSAGWALSAGAAEIAVQPGMDTLEAAAAAASTGDTLTLTTGTYSTSDSNAHYINKALTIRALSSAETPEILDGMEVTASNTHQPIVVQGLKFLGNYLTLRGDYAYALENHFECADLRFLRRRLDH